MSAYQAGEGRPKINAQGIKGELSNFCNHTSTRMDTYFQFLFL